jgi:hypothetical protein
LFSAVTVTDLATDHFVGAKTSWDLLSLGAVVIPMLGEDTESVIVTADVGAVANLIE